MTTFYHPAYPTPTHERSALAIVDFFKRRPETSAVLLTCSCARGKATKNSCLDIAVLVPPDLPARAFGRLRQDWQNFYQSAPVFKEQLQVGAFSQVDLEFHSGNFNPENHPHGWTSGADEFELEVGNLLVYSVPLWEKDTRFRDLKAQWLPYYPEKLRSERLELVVKYCRNNLAHIPLYVERGLYFQAVKRLHNALEEFLQCLFIARRTYPIAYDKWVREQVVDILRLPALYGQIVGLLEVEHLESTDLTDKSVVIENLIGCFIAVNNSNIEPPQPA